MERSYFITGTPKVELPVRVRGLSQKQRYFDEQTRTTHITQDFIVTRLPELVDLDVELHVTNRQTMVGGTFRVAWINQRPDEGLYEAGLELLEQEGEIWDWSSIPTAVETAQEGPTIQLECARCYQQVSTTVPEADADSLREGFIIARPCETCKATTSWAFGVPMPAVEPVVEEPAADAIAAPAAAGAASATPKPAGPSIENRLKGRAPIKMGIQIFRTKYGIDIFDICETINISRTGVYFSTTQGYEPGELVKVVVPYYPNTMSIPVPARVVRQDEQPGMHVKRVALHMGPGVPAA
jgi:hypothetical protein